MQMKVKLWKLLLKQVFLKYKMNPYMLLFLDKAIWYDYIIINNIYTQKYKKYVQENHHRKDPQNRVSCYILWCHVLHFVWEEADRCHYL